MSNSYADAPPPTGPPVSTVPPPPGRPRPWWGLGDVIPPMVLLGAAPLLTLIAELLDVDGADDPAPAADSAAVGVAGAIVLIVLYVAVGGWPFVVSARKGLGPVRDWGLGFRPVDLAYGVATLAVALGSAAAAGGLAGWAVGLDDPSEADNAAFLAEVEGASLVALLVVVVIVAPLAEELVFRGLTLRALEKRAGPVVAVVGSTVLFTLPHYIGASAAGTAVLLASIAAVGAVLAVATIVIGRLWPAVVAHMLLNAVGAAGALGAFG